MRFSKDARRYHVTGDESGATAIEYGLIVGLIAMGLLGALVGTRGSLQSNYSAISSTMGGATAASSTSSPLFANKTVSQRTVSTNPAGQTLYNYTYSDGSVGYYATAAYYHGNLYASNMQLTDPAKSMTTTYVPAQNDVNGNPVQPMAFSETTRYADGNTKSYTYYTADSSGQTVTGTRYDYPDQSGGQSTGSQSVTKAVSTFQSVIDQYAVYKANP
jgi:pilus assembly protein Flp/PilA